MSRRRKAKDRREPPGSDAEEWPPRVSVRRADRGVWFLHGETRDEWIAAPVEDWWEGDKR